MEVKDLQKEMVKFVKRWDKVKNAQPSKDATFFHIVEEIGELASQYVNRESRKEQYSEAEIKDAIGDALMQLVKLADLHNFDMEELITEIMQREEAVLREKEKQSQ